MQLDFDLDLLASSPAIAGLDLSALKLADLVNLILQRSEVLQDDARTDTAIRSWFRDDAAPLADLAQEHRDKIARRAAAVILLEFNLMRPELDAIAPRRLADIGCGYGLFSLFAARTYGCDLLLIDLESNSERHFGYEETGSAYSSLAVVGDLMRANGVDDARVRLLNPAAEDVLDAGEVDLAVSFLSAGFHYPISTYTPFFEKNLSAGGRAIVDLRKRTAREQIATLRPLGSLRDISPPPKARRMLLTKESA